MQLNEDINPENQKRQERFAELDRDAQKFVLSSRLGRRYVWNLLADCGLVQTPFVAGMPDVSAFNSGKQSVAHNIYLKIDLIAPEMFHLMSKESKEDLQYVYGTTNTNNNRNDPTEFNSLAAFNSGKSSS